MKKQGPAPLFEGIDAVDLDGSRDRYSVLVPIPQSAVPVEEDRALGVYDNISLYNVTNIRTGKSHISSRVQRGKMRRGTSSLLYSTYQRYFENTSSAPQIWQVVRCFVLPFLASFLDISLG